MTGIGSVLLRLNRPLAATSRKSLKALWLALGGLTLVVLLLGSANVVREYSGVCASHARAECVALEALGLPWLAGHGLALIALGSVLLTAVPWLVMGLLVFRRKASSVSELLLSVGLATGGASDVNGHNLRFHFFREASILLGSESFGLVVAYIVGFVSQTCVVLVAYLVPDGRFFSRLSVWLALIWTAHVATNTLYRYPFAAFGASGLFSALDMLFTLFAPLTMLFVMWHRHRFASGTRQRNQLRAIFPSAVSLMAVTAAFGLWTLALWAGEDTTTLTTARFTSQFVQGFVQSAVAAWFAIAVGLAISRYNLFGIDLAINRTLVYGGLTATLLALYLLVVLGVGAVFGRSQQLWVPLIATAAVALLLLPLRNALKSLVSRRLYGGRDAASFEVLDQLTSDLTGHRDLGALAQTIRRAMRVPYARVSVDAGTWQQEGQAGLRGDEVRSLPLQVQGQQLGWLEVSFQPGELTDEHEARLLARVADQVALIVQAEGLATELSRSRQTALESREQERLRLRRDLHDGLGPALAAQSLMAASARRLLEADPRQANALLNRLERDIAATLEQARHLIYSLRPPELDQYGLEAALRAKVEDLTRETIAVEVDAQGDLTALPAVVEVALYRVVTEAVTNVVRHARARRCRIELRATGEGVSVSILDDGVGIGSDRKGVGLAAMRERVTELGGRFEVQPGTPEGTGTRVRAWLPTASAAASTGKSQLEESE